ncbi:MAG: hypothetical protein ABFR97_03715 [Thermodesulfobacteriota bacterium]
MGKKFQFTLPLLLIFLFFILLFGRGGAQAVEVSKEQIKGLDEQVQEIKSDMLAIAEDLNQLEEKLLYPSHTQVALFVSLKRGADKFRLDSLDITLDDKAVSHYLYTFKELEALRKGGVQRIYTGNLRSGTHNMQVTLRGKTAGGSDFSTTGSMQIKKGVGPEVVEIILASKSLSFKTR